MSRRPSSFRTIAAAATDTAVVSMSHRPNFRGSSTTTRGRRYYCDQAPNFTGGNSADSVSGDSHFSAIRDANRGFRPSSRAAPPPHPYAAVDQSGRPRGPVPLARASSYNNQQFRAGHLPQPPRRRPFKPPDYREWELAKPGPPPDRERFTVLSYNILADYLATDHRQNLYPHIPQNIMDWNWRKRNIIFELGLWSADILCFQEVDRFQDILEELNPHGYAGIWKMRTGDAVDGCAIFWRFSRFKLLYEESIEYNKLGLRDNVAQICVLQSLNGNDASSPSTSGGSKIPHRVVVCNIHVLFNPKRGEIKLGQIRVLLDKAHSVSRLWDDAPVVVCGDFNSTPMSPIYNFITNQKLDLSNLARDKVSGQVSPETPRSSRPPYPNIWVQDAVNICGASVNNLEKAEGPSSLNASEIRRCSTNISASHLEVTLSVSDPNENPEISCDSVSFESKSVEFSMHEKASLGNESVDDGDELQEGSVLEEDCHPESVVINRTSSRWNWTPAEIEAATGNAECIVVEHPLKLTSAYTRVEDSSGIRDSSGEPLATSYHRRFCGTVDYIWISDGLQPAKILAPIPKHVMHQTRGFPTRKWGSDHIALVSELAFHRDAASSSETSSPN